MLIHSISIFLVHILTDAENKIVDKLRLAYYEIVPAELDTVLAVLGELVSTDPIQLDAAREDRSGHRSTSPPASSRCCTS